MSYRMNSWKSQGVNLLRVLIVAGMACTLAACAASGKSFVASTPSNDHGLIYVYRSAFGSANSYYLSANGVRLTTLSYRIYYSYEAKPGNVTLAIKRKAGLNVLGGGLILGVASLAMEKEQELITIPVEPGEVYYVRFQAGSLKGAPSMELVDKNTAESEMRDLHTLESKE
jgi:hypothetical protein